MAQADWVFHLAGVNRPRDAGEFQTGNVDLTAQLCDLLAAQARPVPLVLSSSIQAELDNPYGRSKRQAEAVVAQYAAQTGARMIYLPPQERLWQMVPPELQFGRRDVLPQHRA